MKRLKLGLIIGVMALSLVGCATQSEEGNSENYYSQGFEYVYREGTRINEIRDTKTGVHYFIRSQDNEGGMTPVIEADGSIKITK